MTNTEHTHKVRYLTPNRIGLGTPDRPEDYTSVIMGRTVDIKVAECEKSGCNVR